MGDGFKLFAEKAFNPCYDCVVSVHVQDATPPEFLKRSLEEQMKNDPSLGKGDVLVLREPSSNNTKEVIGFTGLLDPDYDDVRSIKEAAFKATKKALALGSRTMLVAVEKNDRFPDGELITLLGVLEALYVPLQIREFKPELVPQIQKLGVLLPQGTSPDILDLAINLDAGLRVAKDIGEGDPEHMAPIKVQQYVTKQFKDSCIKVTAVEDEKELEESYPLFAAVNRAAKGVDRHKGRILFLEYSPCASGLQKTLFLVGKGVTYDTGGADIKAGGVMAGMSRDKCGSAAVAGFMEIVKRLQPQDVKVVGAMSMVRNSVGSDAYVADELIKCRSGMLVRIGNTDAEGRMVMADVLCKMRELAEEACNPHIFTIATLTGHAHVAVGDGYTIAMDNGPAAKEENAKKLQSCGHEMADPIEISTLRREDFAFTDKGKLFGDDIMQCNNAPSSRTARGHQFPAAFMIRTSGLMSHGSGSPKPIKYTHLDIAASAGSLPEPCTGAPILALTKTFLMGNK